MGGWGDRGVKGGELNLPPAGRGKVLRFSRTALNTIEGVERVIWVSLVMSDELPTILRQR